MHIDLTSEQQKFRDELRDYFGTMMTEALVTELRTNKEGGGPLYCKALRQMGSDGLLGVGWPEEFGGQGRSAVDQLIFSDEVQRAGYPLPFLTINTVGPTLARYGSEQQKREFVPKILRGELQFAIGYSEPSAGTDLAALSTKATRVDDGWVIQGQKMWTSLSAHADYVWLAARTDPTVKKHAGISIFMVPTTSPGFRYSPIPTVGGVQTYATFYDDVHVPEDALIGGENNGWALITGQLNHERVSLMNAGPMRRAFGEVLDWARETSIDGGKVIDQPWVQANLARVYAKVQVLRLMNWKQAWAFTQGERSMADSSAIKVFGSEFHIEGYRALMEVVGNYATLGPNAPAAILRGRLYSMYCNSLILTFGGGTNEVQRDIIAMAGMGLPHYKN